MLLTRVKMGFVVLLHLLIFLRNYIQLALYKWQLAYTLMGHIQKGIEPSMRHLF